MLNYINCDPRQFWQFVSKQEKIRLNNFSELTWDNERFNDRWALSEVFTRYFSLVYDDKMELDVSGAFSSSVLPGIQSFNISVVTEDEVWAVIKS